MTASTWSPLRQGLFRALWIASVASYLGTAMHDLAAGWLMASLSDSPILVALMQTASNLPIFLVALPAGALADLVDRRRLLLLTQLWMLLVAALLGVLTVMGHTTAWVLLVLTFLLGVGGALNAPAWQAITPELVSREELPEAVALGGIGFNLARTFGPAIGGLIVAAASSGAVFLVNAASFLGVMFVLYRWRREPEESSAPNARLLEAMRAGQRYVRYSPALHAVLVRTAVFVLCGSAMWALLPILGRHELKLSALGYGGLMGCFGLGAVVAATLLPKLRRSYSMDCIVAVSTVLFAAFTLALALTRTPTLAYPVMAFGGVGWMALMNTLNVAAQMSVPAWVRARALAVFLLVFQGGLAAGSALWGTVASHLSVHEALMVASAGLVMGLVAVPRFRLKSASELDFTPSGHWGEPELEFEPHPADGPVLVTVEYEVEPEQLSQFARVMRDVEVIRRRDGAYRWNVYRDIANPRRCVEMFLVESWAEHLRQHQRVTVSDRAIEERANVFHRGSALPHVTHYISAYASSLTVSLEELPVSALDDLT